MILTMVAVWGLIVGLVVWAVRSARPGPAGGSSDERPAASAEGVLSERYARGEIDEDEFQRRRSTLAGNGSRS
jgi:putative membrane protein